MERKNWKVRSVKVSVQVAIAQYCIDNDIKQAEYLEKDRRIKDYLK